MDDIILSGLEDVPKIVPDRCYFCDELLTSENFDGWFSFIKRGNQIYQVPICRPCDQKNSPEGQKIEE